MRILVLRSRESASDVRPLSEKGVELFFIPVLKILPPADHYAALDRALTNLSTFDWMVLTSQNAVQAVGKRYQSLDIPGKLPRIVSIGAKTTEALREFGWRADYTGSGEGEADLIRFFETYPSFSSPSILLPKSDIGLTKLGNFLQSRGARVQRIEAYRTTTDFSQKGVLETLFQKPPDAVLLYSPSQWKALKNLLDDFEKKVRSVRFYVQGETTKEALSKDQFPPAGWIRELI